jgi:hypothetical protein
MPGVKGDVRLKHLYRKECKYTAKKSYAINRAIMRKICNEAIGTEVPVLEIEFQDHSPAERFYVLPEWAWQEYLELRAITLKKGTTGC